MGNGSLHDMFTEENVANYWDHATEVIDTMDPAEMAQALKAIAAAYPCEFFYGLMAS